MLPSNVGDNMKKEKIYILDKNQNFCRSLQLLLRQHGYNTAYSTTCEELMNHKSDSFYHFILIDIRILLSNMENLLEAINQLHVNSIIYITSTYSLLEHVIPIQSKEYYHYVLKPVNIEELLLTFQESTNRKKLINERKKIDQKLKQNERFLTNLLHNLPGMVYQLQLDPEQTLTFASEGCQELIGLNADQLLKNDPVSLNDLIHPDDKEYRNEVLHKALQNKTDFEIQYRIRNIQTEIKWVFERGRFTFNHDINNYHIDGFITDITKQKNLELQLLQSQKMEAFGQFAGGIAHDFNNILTALIGNTNLAQVQTKNQKQVQQYLEKILSSANSAANLVQKLLTFGSKHVLNPQIVNLNIVIDETLKMIYRIIGEDIVINTIYDKNLFNIKSDSFQLEQILINLSVNAREAMHQGGTITIETRNYSKNSICAFDQKHLAEENYVQLIFKDTGNGIPTEIQDKIFEPFFTTKEVGTGLGLSIVYGIVNQSNGFIIVDSKENKGTVFQLYFPITKEKINETRTVDETHSTVKGNESILIVEDDSQIREIIKKTLINYGYQVIEAKDGDEGIIQFNKNRNDIECIICDVIMPHKNGIQLIKEIQNTSSDIPVLFISGYTKDTIERYGFDFKNIQLMQKPFNPNELLKKIRYIIDRS